MKICHDFDKEIATLNVTLKEKKQQLLELAEQQKKKKPSVLEGELDVAMEQKADVDNKQTSCVCENIVELEQSIEGTSLADEVIVPGYEKDNDQVVD